MKATRIYTLLVLLLMVGGVTMQAQIRIDKQQCFGGYGQEVCVGMVMEDDYIMLVGN